MIQKVNWGIIGCGNVTEIKSGPAFNKVKNSRLVAVMRRNAARARDYALRHNVSRWYDNADELIADPEVNAIYVATPPDTHAHYAIKAMEAGKPVYVEKPMALNASQCKDMIRVSEKMGIPLFVAYYRRMLPGFLKVKELIGSGSIGTPELFSIRFFIPPYREDFHDPLPWRVNPGISGGGYIFDLGSHQLDFIDYLFGPVELVSSLNLNKAGLYEPEDYVSAGFRCRGGVAGNGTWWFSAPAHLREDTIEIAGTKGKIKFSCFDFTPVELTIGTEKHIFENPRPKHVQQPLIETVVSEICGQGGCPSTGSTAIHTSLVLDALKKSTVVDLTKPFV